MKTPDWLFAMAVLETPLGRSLEWDDDSEIAKERATITKRYEELKATLGMSQASRQARAEWFQRYTAERQ